MVEYKVLTINRAHMEAELNSLAVQGWRVVAAMWGEGRRNSDIILERNINA